MQVFDASTATVVGICFTPDGRGLVTGSSAGVVVWDITGAPKAVRQFEQTGYFCPVAVSPCGHFLAFGGNFLRVVDLTDEGKGELVKDIGATAVCFAPDGTAFAAPAFTPRQWAVPSWKLTHDRLYDTSQRVRLEHATGVLSYTPDSRSIGLSFGVLNTTDGLRYDSHIMLFDRVTGERTRDLPAVFGSLLPMQIAFSPDGAVVAGNFGPVLGVTSVADGEEVARIKTGTKHTTGLCFTPDGSKLVTVSNDTRVRVFDARTWTETRGYEWKIGKLRCVAVAPDGLRVAAGSDRSKVVIWDVDE